tara:strand:- start:74 stop:385 length:312 start_codon:yes stop_codon:yes gene_type:complete
MIIKKIVIGLLLMCFINGCVQSTAFLGPVYTLASTGSVYQASLSYGSSKAIKKVTGKTTTESLKSILKEDDEDVEEEENHEEFFKLVKKNIAKTSKVLNLVNQ